MTIVTPAAPFLRYAKFMWHKLLPKKISVSLWRLFQKRLPIDEGLISKGFQLASWCLCCSHPSVETFNHLFICGALAASIWLAFKASHVWKVRNAVMYDNSHAVIPSIILAINNDLSTIMRGGNYFGLHNQSGVSGLFARNRTIKIQAVYWNKPPAGTLKLNSDGACRGNLGLSGGGGIIRNSAGGVVYAFSSYLGNATNTVAEIKALFQGVCWLHSHGYRYTIIEMDSMTIFNWLTKGHSSPWSLYYYVRALLSMQKECAFSFRHCFREANSVVDGLANLAIDLGLDSEFSSLADLPMLIRGNAILDGHAGCPFDSDREDVLIWSGTSSGKFSLKSAWNLIRSHHPSLLSTKFIWHKLLSKRINVFIWRLFVAKLPLDDRLQARGFSLASKCSCSNVGQCETISHVFLHSSTATSIWEFFSSACEVTTHFDSIQQACFSWWLLPKTSSLHVLLPSIILWELWKHRNQARYDNSISFPRQIIKQIKFELLSHFKDGPWIDHSSSSSS